jgi:hypothetical protein
LRFQDALRIAPLADLQDYMKFCQSGPSSLPKNSKVAQIARELQQSPNGSPLRGRSPSPTARQGGGSVAIHSLDTISLENSIAEQRVLVLRRIINGFKFDPEFDDASPRRNTSPDRSIRPSNAKKQQALQLHPSPLHWHSPQPHRFSVTLSPSQQRVSDALLHSLQARHSA